MNPSIKPKYKKKLIEIKILIFMEFLFRKTSKLMNKMYRKFYKVPSKIYLDKNSKFILQLFKQGMQVVKNLPNRRSPIFGA